VNNPRLTERATLLPIKGSDFLTIILLLQSSTAIFHRTPKLHYNLYIRGIEFKINLHLQPQFPNCYKNGILNIRGRQYYVASEIKVKNQTVHRQNVKSITWNHAPGRRAGRTFTRNVYTWRTCASRAFACSSGRTRIKKETPPRLLAGKSRQVCGC
jgi:hypothetical protein